MRGLPFFYDICDLISAFQFFCFSCTKFLYKGELLLVVVTGLSLHFIGSWK